MLCLLLEPEVLPPKFVLKGAGNIAYDLNYNFGGCSQSSSHRRGGNAIKFYSAVLSIVFIKLGNIYK